MKGNTEDLRPLRTSNGQSLSWLVISFSRRRRGRRRRGIRRRLAKL